ncbi:hypothetical protein [Ruegeria atlantica]|uniref:hypothetical protein n=1 Tax=Ruegeria atlantica TaxID=81569 RepID=UPI00147AFD3D|nr:hypothetical protein [Ruegeria atlantica]
MAGAFDAPAFRFHRASRLGALRVRANAATEKSEYPMSEKFAICDVVHADVTVYPERFEFVGSLRRVVAPYLQDAYPSLNLLAEIMGNSSRTLQRALARHGKTPPRAAKRMNMPGKAGHR